MQNLGVVSIEEIHKLTFNGILRYEIRSQSSQIEGGIHSLNSIEQHC